MDLDTSHGQIFFEGYRQQQMNFHIRDLDFRLLQSNYIGVEAPAHS